MLAEDTVGAVEARRWFGIAAEQGHAEARATLGTMHYWTAVQPDYIPRSRSQPEFTVYLSLSDTSAALVCAGPRPPSRQRSVNRRLCPFP